MMIVGKRQSRHTGFTMKRRLLSTQNDLVDGLRILSQHTALQLSARCLWSASELVVVTRRVLEVTGTDG